MLFLNREWQPNITAGKESLDAHFISTYIVYEAPSKCVCNLKDIGCRNYYSIGMLQFSLHPHTLLGYIGMKHNSLNVVYSS